MSDAERRVSLKIDLKTGTIELDAPVESFEHAIAKTRELAETLNMRGGVAAAQASQQNGTKERAPAGADSGEQVVSANSVVRDRGRTRSSKSSPSAARPGRIGSFSPIRDLLTEEQQQKLRSLFVEKRPDEQADCVIVALYMGEQLLGRQAFTYNEIYTLLWRAGVEPLPKALDVVVQRLIQEQQVEKGSDGYFLKFIGRNRVERELPVKSEE